ncbi:hypothetical protein M404DRAFT_996155 [Pisolithus tinctorius Marx 270]|uniref:Uncharacterized protein n=1 Tax=Pisolithus tinctorius Marx 270 TaxID=870435 RepID=A0A0C3PP37_PISTI|nr:hypothetical protein M404DRAFT_996155 [Pisolithus tinctorius Marx 270]
MALVHEQSGPRQVQCSSTTTYGGQLLHAGQSQRLLPSYIDKILLRDFSNCSQECPEGFGMTSVGEYCTFRRLAMRAQFSFATNHHMKEHLWWGAIDLLRAVRLKTHPDRGHPMLQVQEPRLTITSSSSKHTTSDKALIPIWR